MPTKSKISTSEITIHQCLHGYENGHTLLSSSLKLEHSLHSTLLILSDLSGGGVVNGFETYLTGYPLGNDFYAFARTWYASEMPRPGCVWTHTLILPRQLFAETKSFDFLLKYFIHPKENDSREKYSKPISITLDNEFLTDVFLGFQKQQVELQSSLYQHPAKTILLQADTSSQYESAILAVWALQWPTLRQSFKFCSGSFSPRKVSDQNFDLEIIPKKLTPTIQRKWVEPFILTTENEHGLANDLDNINQSDFMSFLLWTQNQLPGSRDNFIPVLKLYSFLSNAKFQIASIEHLVNVVGEIFPKSDQALEFKESIFFKKAHCKKLNFLNEFTVVDVLLAIVQSDYLDAFSQIQNFGRKLKETLLNENFSSNKILSALIDKNDNLTVRNILKKLAVELSAETFQQVAHNHIAATFVLLSLNPALLDSEAVWEAIPSESQKRELINAVLDEYPNDHLLVEKLIRIAIKQKADYLANDFFAKAKDDTIYTLFELVISGECLRSDWLLILKRCQSEMISWLAKRQSKSKKILETLSSVIDVKKINSEDAGTDFWLNLWKSYSNLEDAAYSGSRVNIFLLALGFSGSFSDAYKLIESVFLVTHKQLAWKEIDYDDWTLLENELPSLGPWKNWDKCERLRMALVKSFDEHLEWPLNYFLNSCLESSVFQEVLKTIKSNNKSKFLNRLNTYINENYSNTPSWQRNMLSSMR